MLKKIFGKNTTVSAIKPVQGITEEAIIEDLPPLLDYILENIPLAMLPINSVGLFSEDSRKIFQALLTPGVIIVPVGIYRVDKNKFNVFNYDCKLVGGLVFSEDGETVKSFGKDFQPKSGWVSYKLMNLAYENDANIIDLFAKTFDTKKENLLVRKKEEKTA